MIKPEEFYNLLSKNGFAFFTGVPDSLLKDLNSYISEHADLTKYIITANEGNAIGLAAGYHLATGKIPVVYMQNSGLGNTINPLTSLIDREVYSIPLLLVIGWRGEPGVKDEPQHIKMGRIQNNLLEALEIPYSILPVTMNQAKKAILRAVKYMKKHNSPYALIIRKSTFEKYHSAKVLQKLPLTREKALEIILESTGKKSIIVSTTGKTSRELFELREKRCELHDKDFLTVGSMGHSSSIALGIALMKKQKQIVCIDGDGSLIMHMGSLATIGKLQPSNFVHIVINNFAHESVGGQPTSSNVIDIPKLALANNYRKSASVKSEKELRKFLAKLEKNKGPTLIEVKVKQGSREDLGRPGTTPIHNKKIFMKFLKS